MIATSGTVVERMVYTSYGIVSFLTSSWAASSDSKSLKVLFQGGRYDSWINGYDFENRIFLPELMRWMTSDPVGYVNGRNTYQMVLDNPIVGRDPSGLNDNGGFNNGNGDGGSNNNGMSGNSSSGGGNSGGYDLGPQGANSISQNVLNEGQATMDSINNLDPTGLKPGWSVSDSVTTKITSGGPTQTSYGTKYNVSGTDQNGITYGLNISTSTTAPNSTTTTINGSVNDNLGLSGQCQLP